jgi:hypothetical protein
MSAAFLSRNSVPIRRLEG